MPLRPSKRLYPYREPVAPRPAATLILVRDGPAGIEVLLTQRSLQASFGAGAYVFPGGTCDADDAQAPARLRPSQSAASQASGATAIREAFEELGVLLAYDDEGEFVEPHAFRALDRDAPLLPQLKAKGWTLAIDRLWNFCHFTTDPDQGKRFDTRFVLARFPQGQTPVADETEQFNPTWLSPAQAVGPVGDSSLFLMFPTRRVLERIAGFKDCAALFAAVANDSPLWVSTPRAGLLADGRESRHMEHETAYGELLLATPDGQKRHRLDWQHEMAVPLTAHVQRLTAPNPGRMTGPGTNTYIIGDANSGFIVVDPGPDLPPHVERLVALVGTQCKAIICTHSHPDHSPAAAPLQARTGAPILGLASETTARDHSHFTPDRVLNDGEIVPIGDSTLQVIHTPGHAANHLCLFMPEDGLLWSGDHVLNGSTTVVDPPDGNMTDYLNSLDRLIDLAPEFILPAHGHVLAPAVPAMQALKAHRLAREAKVLRVRQGNPGASMDECLPVVYDDVNPALLPIARRSLLAHWERIEALGLV